MKIGVEKNLIFLADKNRESSYNIVGVKYTFLQNALTILEFYGGINEKYSYSWYSMGGRR